MSRRSRRPRSASRSSLADSCSSGASTPMSRTRSRWPASCTITVSPSLTRTTRARGQLAGGAAAAIAAAATSAPAARRSGTGQQDDALGVLDGGEQRGDRLPELRVDHLRRQLGEREQHEAPLVQLGVRDLEIALVDHVLVEEQDVEIDDA